MTATEHVILVDSFDHPIGTAEKIEAHRQNLCHRAFSVFIFRKYPVLQLLLQQRAANKYHSANLWTNTCCSHPRPGEEIIQAAKRRLQEEMGIQAELESLGWFHYIAHFENGLVENEIDHVLIGFIEESTVINPNPSEIKAYQWLSIAEIKQQLNQRPDAFTPWFEEAFFKTITHLEAVG